jgi:myosin heavy subunit
LARLAKLRLEKNSNVLRTFAQAWRAAWNKGEIEGITQRLEKIRNELQFRILVSIKTDVDMIAIRGSPGFSLQDYNQATRSILEAILDNKLIVQAELQVQTKALQQQLVTENKRAEQRHDEVLAAIKSLPAKFPSESTDIIYRIKNLLYFVSIDDREEDIAQAHKNTFEWVYRDEQGSISQWLRQGTNLYWIRGKAGSGNDYMIINFFTV